MVTTSPLPTSGMSIQTSWEKSQAEARLLIGEDGEAALRQVASRLGFDHPAP
jgi:hypothetical protein